MSGGGVAAGPTGRARLAKAPFAQAVLVCGKCARKLPGSGGAKGVRKALKAAAKAGGWGKVRIVETRCFDLCPKRRQVLASAGTLGARRLLVVDPGFDPETALTTLLGPAAGPPRDLLAETEPSTTASG